MKVLFLDFDGVLNNHNVLKAAWAEKEYPMTPEERDLLMIDPEAVERLNEVVRRTNCAVVISSTWRILNTKDELQRYLELRGFSYSVLGCTPRCKSPQPRRGNEIQQWIDAWNEANPDSLVATIAIVDDDSDMEHLMDRLVTTSLTTGLLDEHVEQLVSLLGETPL